MKFDIVFCIIVVLGFITGFLLPQIIKLIEGEIKKRKLEREILETCRKLLNDMENK